MRELHEASIIKADDPKLYYRLAERKEIRRDVQQFIRVKDLSQRHGISFKEALSMSPETITALSVMR